MSYFKEFPLIQYEFPNGDTKIYKNLSIRPAFVDELKNDTTNLQAYTIQDGETPETIAFDVYQDESLNWVIMLMNDVMNLYTDWPQSERNLLDNLMKKYREVEDSDGVLRTLSDLEVTEYLEFVGSTSNNFRGAIELSDSDNGPKVMLKPHHFIDEDGTYYSYESHFVTTDVFGNTIDKPNTIIPISHKDYELSVNDGKREIFIPNPRLIGKIQRELGSLVNE